MNDDERKLLIGSRIRRAQSALDRAARLLAGGSHVETIETALVAAASEVEQAERLLQPVWETPTVRRKRA